MTCCTVLAGSSPTTQYERKAINATAAMVVAAGGTNLADWSLRQTNVWRMDSGSSVVVPMNTTSFRYSRDTGIPVYGKHLYCNDFDYGIPVPRLESLSAKETATSVSQSGRTVTVDLTGTRTVLGIERTGGDVGDIVVDSTTGTVFVVSARTGATIDMVAQNNLDASGNLSVTISLAPGLFRFINCRVYAMEHVHYGDISSSSATISNVKRADNQSVNVNSATSGVQAGDYALTGDGAAIGIVNPTGSQIASVTSNSIVLSGVARYNATGERLTYFVRQATANNT